MAFENAASTNLQVVRDHIHNVVDTIYTAKASFGTPPVTARLIVDTGSSDTWVKPDCYNLTRSTTALQFSPPRVKSLQYGRGDVKGFLVKDVLCLGKLCLEDQGFLSPKKIEKIGNDAYYDGLIGLAFPALSSTGHPVVRSLVNASTPAFALHLGRWNDAKDSSFIAFGEPEDLHKHAKELGYGQGCDTPMHTLQSYGKYPTYWMLQASIGTNGAVGSKVTAILDSGSSLLLAPSAYTQDLLRMAFGSSLADEQCTTKACICDIDVTPLVIEFPSRSGGSLRVELTKRDLLEPGYGQKDGKSLCRINIASSPMDIWILGDTVLRRLYVVHDVRNLNAPRLTLYGTSLTTTTTTMTQGCCGWVHGSLCIVPPQLFHIDKTEEIRQVTGQEQGDQVNSRTFVAMACGLLALATVLWFVYQSGYRAGRAEAVGRTLPHREPLLHGAME
jgi:hypothetical protein